MTIPQDVAIALAAVASLISAWLRDDGLPGWQNALIAGCAFVALTALCMWLIGGFIGDIRTMLTYGIGLAVVLAGNELLALLKYLQAGPSPLAPKMGKTRATVQDWGKSGK